MSPSKLDLVRAKLAAASRPNASRAVIQLDMDMRPQQLAAAAVVADAAAANAVHGDLNAETKYEQLAAAAQQQLDQHLITHDQFNQTMAQLRVQHKTVTSLKRKIDSSAKRGSDLSATSDEDAELSSTSSDTNGSDAHRSASRGTKRDRRTPEETANKDDSQPKAPAVTAVSGTVEKKSRQQRQRKTKWSAPVAIDTVASASISVGTPMQTAVAAAAASIVPQMPLPAIGLPPAFEMPPMSQLSGLWPLAQQPMAHVAVAPAVGVLPPMMWQQPPPTLPPPTTTQLPMPAAGMLNVIPPAFVGGLAGVPVLPQQQLLQSMAAGDASTPVMLAAPPRDAKLSNSITIDGVSRDIRYYGETAIAFMGPAEPRELGFNAGERVIRVDQKDAIRLVFNDAYAPFTIDGRTYQIRFGTPMRELYINQQWFECLFGEPSYIQLADGRQHMFEVEGPSPQVRIGALRRDLCAGRVDLYIDSTHKLTFFLDALPQSFELDGVVHTLQFYDYFMTAMIDGQTFGNVQYGGMPKRFRIGARERFIRFAVLPDGLQAGRVHVKSMLRTDRHRNMASPAPTIAGDVAVTAAAAQPTTGFSLPVGFANVLAGVGAAPAAAPAAGAAPALNINDLLQKLVASGMLDTGNSQSNDGTASKKGRKSPVGTGAVAGAATAAPAVGTRIDFGRAETIKQRQSAHVDALFAGMQCSSCGVRFPAEQTVKYSQHLDWHFRQNRRDRDLARRAHSRRWYYDVSDWVQYEEIEDADEREKSWFEQQQADLGADLGTQASVGGADDSKGAAEQLPSCVAGVDDVDRTCDMCHDRFETFYNEETEDWHLRDAVREDCGTFHPICLKDYRASLTLDESAMRAANSMEMDDGEGDNAVDMPLKREDGECLSSWFI